MKLEKKCLLSVLCVVTMTGILLSCGSAPKPEQNLPQETAVQETESSKKVPEVKTESAKKETKGFTKDGFVEDLQKALKEGSIESALKLYDNLPKEYQDDFDLQYIKASLYVSNNNPAEASEICNNLLKTNPDNIDLLELRLVIEKLTGNNASKTKALQAVIAKDPYNAAANIELAEESFGKKRYSDAQKYYKKALAKDSQNEAALFGMAQTDYYLEKDDDAKEYLNKLLEINPENYIAYLYLGKIAFSDDEYKVASDYALKAIEYNPTDYDSRMDYATYERNLGHFDEALKSWTKAIEIQPDYFLAYACRGGLYDETEVFDKALKDYEMVIKLNPQYYYAYESIAVLAIHEKNYKQAREAFMKCREMNDTNISYPLMITYCYYMEGNSVEAKNYSDSVLRKMDRNSVEYLMLRVFHDKAGEQPLPQRISTISSTNLRGKMYFYLGLFYDMFGGHEAACEFYTKVINMNSPMFFEYRIAEWNLGIKE